MALLAVAGIAILLYPSAGNWFTDRAHAQAITGYTEEVRSLPSGERAAALQRAHTFNEMLVSGRVDDPYGATVETNDERTADYLSQLAVTPSGTMGDIRIPAIDVALPLYHGTSDETLSRGIGHLQGSALPVGGTGTNSVLTGHSGVPQARLFTDLHDIEVGDEILLDILGTTLAYEVDSTTVVLPTETALLQPIQGEDLLTLITCTPVGVNSHRLIVQAHRLPDDEGDPGARAVAGRLGPGFPWWALAMGATITLATYCVASRNPWPQRRRGGLQRPSGRPGTEAEPTPGARPHAAEESR